MHHSLYRRYCYNLSCKLFYYYCYAHVLEPCIMMNHFIFTYKYILKLLQSSIREQWFIISIRILNEMTVLRFIRSPRCFVYAAYSHNNTHRSGESVAGFQVDVINRTSAVSNRRAPGEFFGHSTSAAAPCNMLCDVYIYYVPYTYRV